VAKRHQAIRCNVSQIATILPSQSAIAILSRGFGRCAYNALTRSAFLRMADTVEMYLRCSTGIAEALGLRVELLTSALGTFQDELIAAGLRGLYCRQ